MNGWAGKILRIDLTSQTYEVETPVSSVYHKYIGGKGLAGYYLRDFITRDWRDPDMPLLFFTGPLVATPAPTSGRMTVMSRSPLTGTVGDASVGGKFGTELKKAGWDGIIITGKSDTICGIEIVENRITFSEASPLKGRSVTQLYTALKDKGSHAVIGPSAENNVRFANIMFDGHYAAGRSGLGLLFAVKNLKYISVKGNGKPGVHDIEQLKKARTDIFRLASASPILMGELGLTNYGTAAIYDLMNSRRMMPTDNFRKTHFEAAKETNAFAYKQKFSPKKTGCKGCHILCKKTGKDGRQLPEFETMNHFGALLGNRDISVVVEANHICNDMGMDTISAGSTLACYAEIKRKQLDGKEIISFLKEIANAAGEGKSLGQGSFRYASSMGIPDVSMSVKKLELPAYDPRGAYGMALGYAVSTRGGCHLRAYPITNEILRKPVPTDRFTFRGKARIVKIGEDVNAVVDSLTACKFIFFGATLEEFSKVYTAATGVESSGQDLLKAGERIYYQERMMNTENGFTEEHDDLPNRFFREAGSSGNGINIPPLSRNDFLKARANYYVVRGLDAQGKPAKDKAKELEIPWKD